MIIISIVIVVIITNIILYLLTINIIILLSTITSNSCSNLLENLDWEFRWSEEIL